MDSERKRLALSEVSELEIRLRRESNDLADLIFLRAFCQLFTAGCLEIRAEYRPPLYRQAEGIDLSLLSRQERIIVESAGSFHGECLEDLLLKARQRIRVSMPDSGRKITAQEAIILAELRATTADTLRTAISEAMVYEPPVSSCSV